MPVVLIAGLVLGVLVWFAPTIVVNTPLKQDLIDYAVGDFPGKISIGSASAGWLSSIELNDVAVYDANGAELVHVASVVSDKTLVALLQERGDLGVLRVNSPTLNLVVREDGSNLEDALSGWQSDSTGSSSTAFEIMVANGTVETSDVSSGEQWRAETISALYRTAGDNTLADEFQLDATIVPQDASPGQLRAEAMWRDGGAEGKGAVDADTMPLEVVTPVLRRLSPNIQVSGRMNGQVSAEWGEPSRSFTLTDVAIVGLQLAAADWLGEDQLALTMLTGTGQVTYRDGLWEATGVEIKSDVAELELGGAATVTVGDATSWREELVQAFRGGQFELQGNLDIARLAALLPNTLHLREGTQFTSGQVVVGLSSSVEPSGHVWNGSVQATQLAATHHGRQITWEQPIEVRLAAHEEQDELIVDELVAQATSVKLVGAGTAARGSAQLTGELAELISEAGRFFDVGDLRLSGQLDAELAWEQTRPEWTVVQCRGTASNFEFSLDTNNRWREESLQLAFSGEGRVASAQLLGLASGTASLQAGDDSLRVELVQPVVEWKDGQPLSLSAQLIGDIARWSPRLRGITGLTVPPMNGNVDLTVRTQLWRERADVTSAVARIEDLRLSIGGQSIVERIVKIESKGSWEQASQTFVADELTLQGSALALRADNVQFQASESRLEGSLAYRSDLGRLFQNAASTKQAIRGTATGQMRFAQAAGVTTVEWSSDIAKFEYLTRDTSAGQATQGQASDASWRSTWAEPRLKVTGAASYDPAAQVIRLTRIETAGELASFGAVGTISNPADQFHVQLEGQVAYDLQRISTRLRPHVGDSVRFIGRDTRSFRFEGPLMSGEDDATSLVAALSQLTGEASVAWTTAEFHGFAVGPGEMNAKLASGSIAVEPLQLSVSEGRVHLAPQFSLVGDTVTASLPPGPVAEELRLGPEMCATWLKYIAPLAAEATAAEGRVSVDLASARFPVTRPADGDIRGKLRVHSAQIGPGPLAREVLWIAESIEAIVDGRVPAASSGGSRRWLELPEQDVDFQLENHRVHHRGLQARVGDVVITTSGWVRTDGTMQLVAQVPVRDEWTEKSRYLVGLRGQVLAVPISGTLSRPQVDRKIFETLTRQTVTGAAARLIEKELDDELGAGTSDLIRQGLQLFGPPRQ